MQKRSELFKYFVPLDSVGEGLLIYHSYHSNLKRHKAFPSISSVWPGVGLVFVRSGPGIGSVRSGPGIGSVRSGPGIGSVRSGPGIGSVRSGPGIGSVQSVPGLVLVCIMCFVCFMCFKLIVLAEREPPPGHCGSSQATILWHRLSNKEHLASVPLHPSGHLNFGRQGQHGLLQIQHLRMPGTATRCQCWNRESVFISLWIINSEN